MKIQFKVARDQYNLEYSLNFYCIEAEVLRNFDYPMNQPCVEFFSGMCYSDFKHKNVLISLLKKCYWESLFIFLPELRH